MFVCCECCELSGRGLCDGLITRPEEFYRPWCVVVCDQETSKTRRLKPATWLWKIQPQCVVTPGKQTNILKNCASRWSFTKNHNMMHGKQNVKKPDMRGGFSSDTHYVFGCMVA
jgi:hypothetical protein